MNKEEVDIDKIKSNINEKYSTAKKNMLNKNMTFAISEKNVDELYKNTIKNIDTEYNNFKNQKSHYSIINDADMKMQKLSSELQKITNNFTISLNPLIDTKYIAGIEEELLLNSINQEKVNNNKIIKEKNKDYERNNVMFVTSAGGSVWW